MAYSWIPRLWIPVLLLNPGSSKIAVPQTKKNILSPKTYPADLSALLCTPIHSHTREREGSEEGLGEWGREEGRWQFMNSFPVPIANSELESVSAYPVHRNPRTGLLRTFWVPEKPAQGFVCSKCPQNFPTGRAFLCTLYTETPERAFKEPSEICAGFFEARSGLCVSRLPSIVLRPEESSNKPEQTARH